jgi:hypothetical protein
MNHKRNVPRAVFRLHRGAQAVVGALQRGGPAGDDGRLVKARVDGADLDPVPPQLEPQRGGEGLCVLR